MFTSPLVPWVQAWKSLPTRVFIKIYLISVISVLTEIITSGQTNSVVDMIPNKLHNFEYLKEFQDKL
jgi:hypothetical protein